MNKEDRFHKMWMDVAAIFAQQSHAVRKKVGCTIVKRDRIISQGWNGTSAGLDNTCEGDDGKTLPHVIHAEPNALDKVARDGSGGTEGADLYTTLEPCLPCSVRIANCGIKNVYYREAYRSHDGIEYLQKVGVVVTQLQPSSTDK
jgi:dCMP deaminase